MVYTTIANGLKLLRYRLVCNDLGHWEMDNYLYKG